MQIFNKRGSVTVLLAVIIGTLVSATVLFCSYAHTKANESYAMSCTLLACRSMLSEYDIRLYEDYGIMAYRGKGSYTAERLEYYLNRMAEESDSCFKLENIEVNADTSSYNLEDLTVFQRQLTDAVTYSIGSTDSSILNSVLVNKYVMSFFKYNLSDNHKDRTSRFRYEVEYIAEGKSTDAANLEAVRLDIVAIRTPINVVKIYKDPVRSAEAMAAAELLTPGPEAIITKAVIIAGWAAEDADEESRKIIKGETIDGMDYEDYLWAIVTMTSGNKKLRNIQSEIEANLRLSYYSSFRIADHSTGFTANFNINGKNNVYEHAY